MLTLNQVFAASGLHSGAAMVGEFNLRPLSLASVIHSYERQRRAIFVKLISPRVLLSHQVHSLADLQSLADGPLGLMTQSEVQAAAIELAKQGLFLRYVSKDLRRAVLIGDVPALIAAPAAPINAGNLVGIQDASSGATKVSTGVIVIGTVIISATVAYTAPAVVGAGAEGLVILGAAIVVLGAVFGIGYGIGELTADPPAKQPKSDNTDVPNTIDGEVNGDIPVPDAVAIGSPDNGIDVQGLLTQIGTGALDEIVSNLPLGWDSSTGTALPGIGDLGSGDGSSGDPTLGFG